MCLNELAEYSFHQLIFTSLLSSLDQYHVFVKLGIPLVCGAIGGLISYRAIKWASPQLLKRGIWGYDMGKKGSEKIPEALGCVVALTFIMTSYLVILCERMSGPDDMLNGQHFHARQHYHVALSSMTCMIIYGIIDDIIDMTHITKILIPLGPYLVAMIDYSGPTAFRLPGILRTPAMFFFRDTLGCDSTGAFPLQWHPFPLIGYHINYPIVCPHFYIDSSAVDFGWIFLIYGALVYIFCCDSINIYAGINGLEVGQSLILAITLLIHVLLGMTTNESEPHLTWCASMLIIFICVSLPLYNENRYPAKVFVGNSYTAFAGVFFASLAFLGYQNRIIIPLFIPQLVNAILSIPQLLRIVPCPRHRVPVAVIDEISGQIALKSSGNLTLINLLLELAGPMHERTLVNVLLSLQAINGVVLLAYLHL